MKIALIGAGNVATHLGNALAAAGHRIIAVYSRTASTREDLTKQLPGAMAVSSLDLSQFDVEVAILAVPDAALAAVAKSLHVPSRAIVAHTSGSQPLEILKAAENAHIGVFYPLQTFSKSKPVDFKTIPVLLEATDENTLQTLQEVAATITEQVHQVDSAKRKQLHLSAVFACNFTNHLLGISRELLDKADLPVELLHPLIQETVTKALQHHPFQVQTGPAIRHDQNVIQEHLLMLQANPLHQELYQKLTQSIQAHVNKNTTLPD